MSRWYAEIWIVEIHKTREREILASYQPHLKKICASVFQILITDGELQFGKKLGGWLPFRFAGFTEVAFVSFSSRKDCWSPIVRSVCMGNLEPSISCNLYYCYSVSIVIWKDSLCYVYWIEKKKTEYVYFHMWEVYMMVSV